MKKYAVIVAGGSGVRMGSSITKQFLLLNDKKLMASQADATLAILGVAASEISELEFAAWVRRNSKDR